MRAAISTPVIPAFVFSLSAFSSSIISSGIWMPGNVRVHVAAHTYRFRNLRYPAWTGLPNCFAFSINWMNFSGSYTACVWKYSAPAATFLSIFGELNVNRIAAGRNNRSFCEFRRLAHQLVSAQIHAGLQLFYRMDQRYGIQIKYGFRS